MIFHSLRWRLQIWHGLILVLVLAGFALLAYHVALDNQMRRIDQELDQQLMAVFRPRPQERRPEHGPDSGRFDPSQFRQRLRETILQNTAGQATATNGFYVVLWEGDGSVLVRTPGAPADVPRPEPGPEMAPPGPEKGPGARGEHRPFADSPGGKPEPGKMGPAGAGESAGPGRARGFGGPEGFGFGPGGPGGPPGATGARTRGTMREVYRFIPRGSCVLIGRSLAPDLAAMRRLAYGLGAIGASVLVLGLVGGWWLAARAIRPIDAISATASKIAAGDLSQRINAADTDSELGRLAGVLNATFARLEAAFAHQARFTSDASHELRTPVAVILSQTQSALARERSPADYRETLEACQRAAQRMRKLTESLLELARLDAGQEPMRREWFDLGRVVRDCTEIVRPLAAERGVEMHLELPVTDCLGDPERIGQVVTNLLTNAITYNRERGEIHVSTTLDPGAVRLTVTDTGDGISAEDLPHIFERFYRADPARARARGSTGLGLAICKAILDAHSGTIEVSSKPGTGSAFTVKLPRATRPPEARPAKPQPATAAVS